MDLLLSFEKKPPGKKSCFRIEGNPPSYINTCPISIKQGSYNQSMTTGSRRELEFHDSVLHSVTWVGQTCLIALRPAYVYEVNVESGEFRACMKQDAVFEFDGGRIEGILGDLPDPILEGSIGVELDVIEHCIPVPFDRRGTVTLKLFLWPDYREINVSAQSVSVRLEGEALPEPMPPN